jgi:hypothetical protein
LARKLLLNIHKIDVYPSSLYRHMDGGHTYYLYK